MKVFADAFFFLAMLDSSDAAHGPSVELAAQPWSEIVTTEFVLIELGNALSRIGDRDAFLDILRSKEWVKYEDDPNKPPKPAQ